MSRRWWRLSRWWRRLPGLQMLLLLSVSVLHLLGLLLVLLLQLLSSGGTRMLLRQPLMVLLLVLGELLVLLLLLVVEPLLLLLIFLVPLSISGVGCSRLRMRWKVLRMDRSGWPRNVVLGTPTRCIAWMRRPFSRAGWRTTGRRWLSYGVITRGRLTSRTIGWRMVSAPCCLRGYHAAAAECRRPGSSRDGRLALVRRSP